MTKQPVVLVETNVGWRIGVQREAARAGFVTVFLPGAPNPHSGEVYLVPADRNPLPRGQASRRPQLHETLRHGSARRFLRSVGLSAFVRE